MPGPGKSIQTLNVAVETAGTTPETPLIKTFGEFTMPRYSVLINDQAQAIDDMDTAVRLITADPLVADNVRTALLTTGRYTSELPLQPGSVIDLCWDDAERARAYAKRAHGIDGEIEFDPGQMVVRTEDGWSVGCWVWVTSDEAGCENLDEDADEDNVEAAYIAAAYHDLAEFDADAQASLGDDPGAYVSGWVHVSETEASLKPFQVVVEEIVVRKTETFTVWATDDDNAKMEALDLSANEVFSEGKETYSCNFVSANS